MLNIVYSNDLRHLATLLTEHQRAQPLPPFEAEVVMVQSNELARWLTFYQASQQGIAANIDYPFPSAYLWRLFRRIWPEVPVQSAYDKEALTWRLFDLLPDCCELPDFERVKAYVSHRQDSLQLYELASRIADTFDQYLMYRPDWIQQWEQGETPHWQARLWALLTQDDAEPQHRANLLQRLYRLLQTGEINPALLPKRLSIFGLSAMPPVYLQLFEAMAEYCDISFYYLSPSQHFWGDVISPKQLSRQQLQLEVTAETAESHPLLASLGKQGQAFFQQLQEIEHQATSAFIAPRAEHILGRMQADIFDLTLTAETQQPIEKDDSIRLHICHSAMREIEVLHDQLLALLEQHPELSPTDIVVMTPDIDAYAPWIEAVFATAEGSHYIPFSIADSQSQQDSVLFDTWFSLLALPQSRFDVDMVFTLLECPAIQRQFDLDMAAVQRCRQWCQQTYIRWGLNGEDKAALALPADDSNTWEAGLARLLLGYAMPLNEGDNAWQLFDGQLAFDGIRGESAQNVASLARLLELLDVWRQRLSRPRNLAEWQQTLLLCLSTFFADDIDEQTQLECTQLRQQLTKLAENGVCQQPVGIDVISRYLQMHLQPLNNTHRFMGHGVTFCGMVPMRSIPFDIMCLIGMNDDVFPRRQPVQGFDLLSQQHRRGDRSQRDDDRYLFLEALISAQQQLYISYVGASIVDNTAIPPSVLVSELLDYLDQRFVLSHGEKLSTAITTKHPLQAFSRRYFDGSQPDLFSYKQQQCPTRTTAPVSEWFSEALTPADEHWRSLSLLQLGRFFQHPARYLCQQRLSINLALDEDALETREPFALDGLAAWQVRQLLLAQQLQQQTRSHSMDIARATGMLPPGQMGELSLAQEADKVDEFMLTLQPYLIDEKRRVMVDLVVDGFVINDQLTQCSEQGLLHFHMSQCKGHHVLKAWVEHLVLNCIKPDDIYCQTRVITENEVVVFKPLAAAEAEAILAELLQLYWQGLHQPLVFFDKTSWAYAVAAHGDTAEKAMNKAVQAWEGSEYNVGEQDDPYHRLIYRQSPLDTHFAELCMRVYQPLFLYKESEE